MDEKKNDNNGKKQKLELYPRWRQVVDEILKDTSITYGSLLSHEWLDRKLELVAPTSGGRQEFRRFELRRLEMIARLREELLEQHRMLLDSVPTKGYRVVLPSEQTKVVKTKLREELGRNFRKAYCGYAFCATENLTPAEREENVTEMCRLGQMKSAISNIFHLAHPGPKNFRPEEKKIEMESESDKMKRENAELREQLQRLARGK